MPRGQRYTNGFINIKSKCDRFFPRCLMVSLVRTEMEKAMHAQRQANVGGWHKGNLGAEKVFRLHWHAYYFDWYGQRMCVFVCVCVQNNEKNKFQSSLDPKFSASIHLADIWLYSRRPIYSYKTFKHTGQIYRIGLISADPTTMRHSTNVLAKTEPTNAIQSLMMNTQFTIW